MSKMSGRLVLVGISPAPGRQPYCTAFVGTRSGRRLAELLDVDFDHLADEHDLENLFPGHPGQTRFPGRLWTLAASALLTRYPQRVIVGCGSGVSLALGAHEHPGGVALSRDGGAVASIPHPTGRARARNEPETTVKARKLLAGCVELADRPAPYTDTDIAALADLWSNT